MQEMSGYDELFSAIEAYEGMTVQYLAVSSLEFIEIRAYTSIY
jgi:hypothetical protein